jgi:hypothetical protein
MTARDLVRLASGYLREKWARTGGPSHRMHGAGAASVSTAWRDRSRLVKSFADFETAQGGQDIALDVAYKRRA